MTDDHLRDVADAFRTAEDAGRFPIQALMQHYGIARTTAGKWVLLARQRGWLEQPKRRSSGLKRAQSAAHIERPGDQT
jgi:hypothetical protein